MQSPVRVGVRVSSWCGATPYFELDRYDDAVPHLRRGLDRDAGPHEAEVRFRHCLGYALQRDRRRAPERV